MSGRFGIGEYARCRALARAVQHRWPQIAVHFALSMQAPYAGSVPFPATLFPSSPTFHTAGMLELLRQLRPQIVIFDNAGRTEQLRYAHELGCSVVYISARRRQRRKAFRLRWMRVLDEHWIAYPEFIAGALRLTERLKLRWLKRPNVRFLDVVWLRADSNAAANPYAIVVPGGGTGHPGVADATTQFYEAARAMARAGIETVFVGPRSGSASDAPALQCVGALDQADLAARMQGAALIITNGGATLMQALAVKRPCIAAPIAVDQRERVRICGARGLVVASALDGEALGTCAIELWRDAARRKELEAALARLSLANGVDVALAALANLLARRSSRA